MKEYLLKYIKDNLKSIKIFFLCLIVGLVVGILVFQFLDEGTRHELTKTMQSTLELTKSNNFEGVNVIKNGITSNLLIVCIVYFVSITLIAPALICIINIFKGFAIGIYIPTIFAIFGFGNGMLVMLLIVILPNLLYIPSFIYMCTNAINFHYNIMDRMNKQSKISILVKEAYKMIIASSIIFLSVVLEQLLSMGVISIYKSII